MSGPTLRTSRLDALLERYGAAGVPCWLLDDGELAECERRVSRGELVQWVGHDGYRARKAVAS